MADYKLDKQKGYTMLLQYDLKEGIVEFVNDLDVNIGDALMLGYRTLKVVGVNEQREAKGVHNVPNVQYFNCQIVVTQDLTPVKKA